MSVRKGPSEKVETFALDSSYYDKERGILHLYGNARVSYQGFELDADYIRYNDRNHTVFARGSTDSAGRYINRPVFKSENEGTGIADSLIYNTQSSKLIIYNLFTEQEGGFFSGGIAKKQPDDEVHIYHKDFSTCNLAHPHFAIFITKGIATKNQIITSWAYLKVEDVPLPIGVPFAFIPKPNKKASGLIIGTPTEDPTRGFMLENFGYYLGLNDYWDAKFLGTVTTRGSYNASVISNYTKRYKFQGNLNLNYASTRLGLEGTPEYKPRKDYSIMWSHSQNPNARPGTTFSASVNAQTSTYQTNTAAGYSYDLQQIANNALRSSISYGKVFADGLFNFNASLGHSQETQSKTVSLTLPDISLNMTSLSPFASKKNVNEPRWYEKLTVGYSMQGKNSVYVPDSLLFKKDVLGKFQNGVLHNVPINLGFNLFQYLNFSTGVNYTERWYFQTLNKRFFKMPLGAPDSIAKDTVGGFKRAGEYSLGISMSTKLYSKVVEFSHLGNIKKLRHVMSPSIGLSYNPDFTSTRFGVYRDAFYQDGSPVIDAYTNSQLKYSSFENGIFGGPSSRKSANINFGIENNVELKIADPKDTTGTGEKTLPIIQSLTINGSYNFVAPTRRLSNISFSGRSQLSDKLGFSFSGMFSPYTVSDIVDVNGQIVGRQETNEYTFKNGKLPRIISFGLSFDYSLNPEALKRRNTNMTNLRDDAVRNGATPEQADQLASISRDPNAFVDFKIPWNFAFSYNLQYSNPVAFRSELSNTLNFSGDVNITSKWKVQFASGFDFKRKDLTPMQLAIYRDLHCWDLSINWVPYGAYKSYSIDLRVRASILQDLKLTKRKGYYTRY